MVNYGIAQILQMKSQGQLQLALKQTWQTCTTMWQNVIKTHTCKIGQKFFCFLLEQSTTSQRIAEIWSPF